MEYSRPRIQLVALLCYPAKSYLVFTRELQNIPVTAHFIYNSAAMEKEVKNSESREK